MAPSHWKPSFSNCSHVSFPQTAALPALLQHGSISWGQFFRHCSTWVPTGGSSPSPLAPLLSCICSYGGSPWAVPPSGLIHCCTMGSSMAACGDLLHMVPIGCRGTACSTIGHSQRHTQHHAQYSSTSRWVPVGAAGAALQRGALMGTAHRATPAAIPTNRVSPRKLSTPSHLSVGG